MTPRSIAWVIAALSALLLVVPVASASAGADGAHGPSAVFAMTNAATGNAIVAYERSSTGALTWVGNYSTGGNGTGASLASQGSLVATDNGNWLLAVDGGSNQISVLSVNDRHGSLSLALTDVASSDGVMPVSLATFGPLVYVLNVGNATVAGNIAGFYLSPWGTLLPIHGSRQPLSSAAATGAAEIAFDPLAAALVVTEKATNLIDVYALGFGGRALPPQSYPSQGGTPYGFAVSPAGAILVSEASTGSLSSYRIGGSGGWTVLSSSVPDFQTAPCWVVVSGNGRYAYTTNADSNTISSYAIGGRGTISLQDEVAAATASTPTDLAVSADGQFLYVRDAGAGEIQGFELGSGGSLVSVGGVEGLPASAEGLVAL